MKQPAFVGGGAPGTQIDSGKVVYVGLVSINVSVRGGVFRDVSIAPPLSIDDISVGDEVALIIKSGKYFAFSIISQAGEKPQESKKPGTYRPPAPVNVKLITATDPAHTHVEWEWGGTPKERLMLDHYEVDARKPGDRWGYGIYPLSEGTKANHFRPPNNPTVQVRVRAVDFHGLASDWALCPDLLFDNIAPSKPVNLRMQSNLGSIVLSWDSPNFVDTPDLSHFEIFVADTDTGGNAAFLMKTTSTSETIPVELGLLYYNVLAVDIYGNVGDIGDTWIEGYPLGYSEGQLLTNADWERPNSYGSWPQDWTCSDNLYGVLTYQSSGGCGDGACIKVDGMASVPSYPYYEYIYWPVLTEDVDVFGDENAFYTATIYIKPYYPLGPGIEQIIDDGWFNFQLAAHDGSSVTTSMGLTTVDSGHEKFADGWYRYWEVLQWLKPTGYDYLALFLNITVVEDPGGPPPYFIFYLDRPQLQKGQGATPFTLASARVGSASGLSLDTSGIIAPSLYIAKNGEVASDFLPDAGSRDVGSTTHKWTDGHFSGDLYVDGTIYADVTPGAHEETHILAGSDEIDGDKLGISWNPSNYTPLTTPSEVDNVDHLTAHLAGIDATLLGIGAAHAANHITGGSDQVDGDKIDIDWNPSEYIPTTAPSEVDSVDNLTAHLAGIDNALNGKASSTIEDESYLVLALTSDLANERRFQVGDGLDYVDGGAGGDYTVSIDVTDFIDTSYGLTESLNNIRINLASPGGLYFSSGALRVGAGDGIDVLTSSIAVDVTDLLGTGLDEDGSNNIILPTPGGLSVSSGNSAAAPHTHAIASSANPGATESLLKSTEDGYLTLIRLNADTLADKSGGNLLIAPAGDVTFDPTGNDILPVTGYDLNLGSLSKKYLTLYAAELWVETLVAQDTIATIGGRILVGPTTQFAVDLAADTPQADPILNGGFETAGAGGSDVFANWLEVASDGSIAQDWVLYNGGAYSCKIGSGTTGTAYVAQTVSATGNDTIRLTFWARGNGTSAGRYRIWDLTNGVDIVAITTTGVTAATWTKVTVDFTVPPTCTQVQYFFYSTTVASTFCWFDDVSTDQYHTITTKHNQMTSGDIAYAEAGGFVEFFEVIGGPTVNGDYYNYKVLRDLDGTGGNAWYAGDALFNTGAAGDGFIDLYSYSGVTSGTYGPTIVGNVRGSGTYNDWSEHWAIGNLNGLYGYGVDTYGVGLGEYGDDHVTIDPTGGIRFRDASNNVQAQLTGGVWTIGQVGAGLSNIQITSGAINMRTNETKHIVIETDGDLFIGEDISAAATTNIAIFTNAQTYNSESVSAGDVLIGDNTTNKNNIFWDKSAGELQFRTGASRTFSLSPSYAGRVVWYNSLNNEIAYLEGNISGGGIVASFEGMQIVSEHASSNRSVELLAGAGGYYCGVSIDAGSTDQVQIYINNNSELRVSSNLVQIYDDLRVGGGIYAGSTSIDPATGYVQSTVGASGWLPFVVHAEFPNGMTSNPAFPFSVTISRSMTLRSWHQTAYVATTNNGSNYWTIKLYNEAGTEKAALSTASMSAGAWTTLSLTGQTTSLSTSDKGLFARCDKVGSPGPLYLRGPAVFVT